MLEKARNAAIQKFVARLRTWTYGRRQPSAWIFSHIPKTAGTELLRWLESTLGVWAVTSPRNLPSPPRTDWNCLYLGHMNPDEVVRYGLRTHKSLSSGRAFTVVRHPVQRIQSLYGHFVRHAGFEGPVDSFVDEIVCPSGKLSERSAFRLAKMSRPMVFWTEPRLWPGPAFIVRLEDGQSGFSKLSRRLGVSDPPLFRPSLTARGEIQAPSKAAIAQIEHIYREDFLRFDY